MWIVKKFAVAILAFLYINIASGVMVNVHYCMGAFASVEYGSSDLEKCGRCGMKEQKGCCDTEYKFVKLQDEHQLAKIVVDFNQFDVELIACTNTIDAFSDGLSFLALKYHSPPDSRANTVYLHNRVFRI